MTNVALHWRCGRPLDAHSDWCSDGTPNDCTHCGGNPCRWWCIGDLDVSGAANPNSHESRERRAMYRDGRLRVMEPA